jgi:hypothetical protein
MTQSGHWPGTCFDTGLAVLDTPYQVYHRHGLPWRRRRWLRVR